MTLNSDEIYTYRDTNTKVTLNFAFTIKISIFQFNSIHKTHTHTFKQIHTITSKATLQTLNYTHKHTTDV